MTQAELSTIKSIVAEVCEEYEQMELSVLGAHGMTIPTHWEKDSYDRMRTIADQLVAALQKISNDV